MEISPDLNGPEGAIRDKANRRLAVRLSLVAIFFVGFGFALVPLYNAFCKVTGFNGRTNEKAQAADKNTQVDATRWVTVQFLSHTMPGVNLDFAPEEFSVKVNPGALSHTNFTVTNKSDRVFVGQAIPSITPATAAIHFQKVECFCFNEQTFQPGEKRTMPVVFVVKPDLDKDMRTVTLSYTFFEAVKKGG